MRRTCQTSGCTRSHGSERHNSGSGPLFPPPPAQAHHLRGQSSQQPAGEGRQEQTIKQFVDYRHVQQGYTGEDFPAMVFTPSHCLKHVLSTTALKLLMRGSLLRGHLQIKWMYVRTCAVCTNTLQPLNKLLLTEYYSGT